MRPARGIAGLLAGAVAFGPAAVAHAYSYHTSFDEPALAVDAGAPPSDGGVADAGVQDAGPLAAPGGGQGRYFTGAVRDGYTCAVCHVGGTPPDDAAFAGLPDDGYVPGTEYTLTLTLPSAPSVAGAIEITDALGDAAGTLAVKPEDGLEDADRCMDGALAGFVTDLPQSRSVANVDACGASRLQVLWTAPNENAGALWVNVVAVAGNGDGRASPPADDPEATDGVYALATLLPHYGDRPEVTRVTSCTASAPARGGTPLFLLTVLLPLALLRRRR